VDDIESLNSRAEEIRHELKLSRETLITLEKEQMELEKRRRAIVDVEIGDMILNLCNVIVVVIVIFFLEIAKMKKAEYFKIIVW